MSESRREVDPVDPLEEGEGAGLEEPERRLSEVADALHGQRLDKVLVQLAPEFSRGHLQALIAAGHVRVDGRACDSASVKVRAGQRIELDLVPPAQGQAFRAEAQPIDIVYEDEHVLVLDKRAGWVVHPAAGNWSGTLLNALLAHHRGAAVLPRAGIVHRLDKDTSGLLVVAKTLAAFTAMVRAIGERTVQREYLAIAQGVLTEQTFSVEEPIGRDPRVRVRMAAVAQGKPARTDFSLVAADARYTALRCTLHTGRTHQIRVHLASRGHPLVGDGLYGGSPGLGMERQALHAVRLAFVHPVAGRTMAFVATPPPDFLRAWNNLIE